MKKQNKKADIQGAVLAGLAIALILLVLYWAMSESPREAIAQADDCEITFKGKCKVSCSDAETENAFAQCPEGRQCCISNKGILT